VKLPIGRNSSASRKHVYNQALAQSNHSMQIQQELKSYLQEANIVSDNMETTSKFGRSD